MIESFATLHGNDGKGDEEKQTVLNQESLKAWAFASTLKC